MKVLLHYPGLLRYVGYFVPAVKALLLLLCSQRALLIIPVPLQGFSPCFCQSSCSLDSWSCFLILSLPLLPHWVHLIAITEIFVEDKADFVTLPGAYYKQWPTFQIPSPPHNIKDSSFLDPPTFVLPNPLWFPLLPLIRL